MCYDPVMQRGYERASDTHPGQWDRFLIRTRWIASERATRVYLTSAEAGKDPEETATTFRAGMEDYHTFISELSEELLDEGWRER